MKDSLYIASCTKNGGVLRCVFHKTKGYVKEELFSAERPMYLLLADKRMHILLRDPFEGAKSGYIHCELASNGALRPPSETITTEGEIACHLTAFQGNVYCANYACGTVTKIGVKTVNHNRSDLPPSHPHYIGATPDGKYLCVTDLGQDLIYLYNSDLTCVNTIKMPKGHGVRQLIFSKDGRFAFTANELASTVSALAYHDGNMRLLNTIRCLPETYQGESFASAIRIYKEHIFVANRGHNSIAKLFFNGETLRFMESFDCGGKTPRDFIFHENRLICANQHSHSVTVFEEDTNNQWNCIQQINIDTPLCVVCEEE